MTLPAPAPARGGLRLANAGLSPLDYHIQDFLLAKRAAKAPATVAFYALPLRQYRAHVGPLFWPPTDSSINSYLAACRDRGCSDGTIGAYYRAIKTWLNWLHRRGKIEVNPVEFIERPARVERLPLAPAEEQLALLFARVEVSATLGGRWLAVRDLALLHLALDSGLRISEIAALWVGDVDLGGRSVRVAPSKNNKERKVVLSREACDGVGRWVECRAGLGLAVGVQALFVSRLRVGLTTWGIRQMLDRRLREAELSHFHFHALRHAYAIYTLRNGGDLADIQAQLGHKDLATTAIYLRSEPAGRARRHARTSPLRRLKQAGATD